MQNDNCWYKEVCTLDNCNSCIRFLEMQELMRLSNIPIKRQFPVKLTPTNDHDYNSFIELANIKNNIKNFVTQGNNLYIYSENTGNGKTSWAIKLMLKYFDEVWAGNGFKRRGVFIHVPTFLSKLKNFNIKDEEFDNLKESLITVDLVIWDDIASTELSSYDFSQLLTYIDQRCLNEKSNIFTGNRDGSDIEKALGGKLASRVWTNSQKIKLIGGDNRGTITNN